MRRTLTVKSLVLLFAFLAGFSPPVPGTGSAEAQVRSSGREVSRQAVRDHRQGSVNRTHRGQRPQVNRSHVNRGQVYRGRTVVRHHRPAHVVVVHPRRHWNRGGAIAAGAAVSWAGPPPRSGYCWFYTTPARTTGFWDWCPVR